MLGHFDTIKFDKANAEKKREREIIKIHSKYRWPTADGIWIGLKASAYDNRALSLICRNLHNIFKKEKVVTSTNLRLHSAVGTGQYNDIYDVTIHKNGAIRSDLNLKGNYTSLLLSKIYKNNK